MNIKIIAKLRDNKIALGILKQLMVSVLLIAIALVIDYRFIPVIDYIPFFFRTSLKFSINILGILMGAFLTAATFSFTTVLTVLNIYLSNYTPRMLKNLLHQKETARVIGLFSGGFIYCITMLYFVGAKAEEPMVIAGTVAAFYSIYAIGYFVYFVIFIIKSIEPFIIMENLTREVKKSCRDRIDRNKDKKVLPTKEDDNCVSTSIISVRSGYFEDFDESYILEAMAETGGQLFIKKKIGEHSTKYEELAVFRSKYEPEEECIEKIQNSFLIQAHKDAQTDYRFGISKLVEVALRAISPGINDPNTAIYCIHNLGEVLGIIASINPNDDAVFGEDDVQIIFKDFDLWEDLNFTFEQLLHYGGEDISVVRSIFVSLQTIYDESHECNRQTVIDFEEDVFKDVSRNFDLERDLFKLDNMRINRFKGNNQVKNVIEGKAKYRNKNNGKNQNDSNDNSHIEHDNSKDGPDKNRGAMKSQKN